MKYMRLFVWGVVFWGFASQLSSAVVAKHEKVAFGPTAFLNIETFFLGASTANPEASAVVRAVAATDEKTEKPLILLNGIAPKEAKVNIDPNDKEMQKKKDKDKFTVNPVYDQTVVDMGLFANVPLVVLGGDSVTPILGANQKICLIGDSGTGKTVATNKVKLQDYLGRETRGVVKVVGGSSMMFAAIKSGDSDTFGVDGSGIATLMVDKGALAPLNAATGKADQNQAIQLSVAAGALVAISSGAIIGSVIDMHWDYNLKRLFVALHCSRADFGTAGGVVAVLVGREEPFKQDANEKPKEKADENAPLNGSRFILEPVVALDANNFTTGSTNHIIGSYFTGAGPESTLIYKVRTMNTTTARSLLIVNGGVVSASIANGNARNQIYALPIVLTSVEADGSSTITNKEAIGKLAQFGTNKLVSGAATMPLATDARVLVGGGVLPIASTQNVQTLFVSGDAVFAGVAGNGGVRDAANDTGMFYSQALFDQDGNVIGWTPWHRVMGSIDSVYAGGFDVNIAQAQFMYLTQTNGVNNTVKLTEWGRGSNDGLLGGTSDDALVGFVELLTREFPSSVGGVSRLFDFDNATAGLVPVGTTGNLSLMVACGNQKVALIETGAHDGTRFTPHAGDFATDLVRGTSGSAPQPGANTRVMLISGGALDTLGPISCAEVSRVGLAAGTANGWLFVGGPGGVAVLSTAAGAGWNTVTGLASHFSGITSSMSFKRLGTINDVRTLACDGSFLYILTDDTLYRLPLTAANFSTAGATAIAPTILARSTNFGGTFADMVISSKLALLATSNGLFRVGDGANIATAASEAAALWTEVSFNAGISGAEAISLGAVERLVPVFRADGSFATGGNLYVVRGGQNRFLGSVVRYNIANTSATVVSSGTVTQIMEIAATRMLFDFGAFRTHFATDGAVAFQQLSENFELKDFLRVSPVASYLADNNSRGKAIDLDVDELATFVGPIVRSFASGSWVVPGDFGIRVNE